jgi:hypothetical protein
MSEGFIKKLVGPLRRKLYVERLINKGLDMGVIYSLVLLALAITSHIIKVTYVSKWIGLISGVFLIALIILMFFIYPSLAMTIKVADSLGCSERIMTAWEFRKSEEIAPSLQRRDMETFTKGRPFHKLYKKQINYKRLLTGVLIASVAICLFFVKSPRKLEAREQEALDALIEEQIENLETAKEEHYEDNDISEEKQEEIDKILEQLMEQIKASETEEELIKNMDIAKNEMKKLDEGNLKEDLKKLASSLEDENLEALTEAIEEMDMAAIEEQLEELMEALEKGELDESLVEALEAAASEMSNEALSEALEQLAANVANGDVTQTQANIDNIKDIIQASLNSTDGNMSQFSQDMQGSIKEGLGQMASATSLGELTQGNMSANGPGGSATQGQVSEGAAGQGGSSQGGSSSQGSGGEGGNGEGNAAGEGSTNEDEGYHEDDGSGGNKGGGDYKEGEYEAIYQPNALGGSSDPSYVQGAASGDGNSIWQNVDGVPIETGELIDYQDIYLQYQDEALQHIDSLDIPIIMQDIVMDYFSSIE